eukprot:5207489-Pleurochrysis_carterae.AAC.4
MVSFCPKSLIVSNQLQWRGHTRQVEHIAGSGSGSSTIIGADVCVPDLVRNAVRCEAGLIRQRREAAETVARDVSRSEGRQKALHEVAQQAAANHKRTIDILAVQQVGITW